MPVTENNGDCSLELNKLDNMFLLPNLVTLRGEEGGRGGKRGMEGRKKDRRNDVAGRKSHHD